MKKIIFILVIVSIIIMAFSLCFGSVFVSPKTTLLVLLQSDNTSLLSQNIILKLRLPRVLLGFIVGALLSVCGVSMQVLVKNSLADPYILGVSNGAGAFATLSMVFGAFSFFGIYALSISAFLGAMFSTCIVYFLSIERGRVSVTKLLLIGVVVSMIMGGITSVIKISAPNTLGLHNAEFWLSGSLAGAKSEYLLLPFIVLVFSITFLMINYRSLNSMLLGDDTALNLGVNVKFFQKALIILSSLMAGVAISVSGTIGFIGLIVPHFTRLIVGGDHKKVIPICALLGGIIVVLVDVLARCIISPQELPVGILTAIIGGPIFIIILKRGKFYVGS